MGAIYYTTDGSDPRLPDGNPSPGARVYEGTLTLTNSARLSARTFATNTWSALVEAYYPLSNEASLRVTGISRRSDGSVKLDFLAWPGLSYTLLAATTLSSASVVQTYGYGVSPEWEAIALL